MEETLIDKTNVRISNIAQWGIYGVSNSALSEVYLLDTHLGSGSSRIAANKAGLDFVGFEIDEDYFNESEKRFKRFVSQTRLF